MNKKLFLTSCIAMGFVAPAIAEPSNTGTFPNDGLMQADYTYTNAATSTNMDGVYEGTVDAVAQYTDVLYQIAAGEYLPADSETVINCNQPGYFCPGVSGDVYYDETNDQGLTSCSTATNGDYTLSDGTGSTADSCYRQCSGNVTIAHATGVTGNDYYGNGTDTCEPTGCVNGWHLKQGLNLTSAIGTGEGTSRASIDNSGSFSEKNASYGQSYYGISDNNTWAVDYGLNKGVVVGQGRCSTQAGSNGKYTNGKYDNNNDWSNTTKVSNLTDETGQEGAIYCYCNVIGYIPDGGTLQSLSSSWVFRNRATACGTDCAAYCGEDVLNASADKLAFRAALLGSVQPGLAMCEANVITINWGDTDLADVTANEAGTATYGEDIRTPVKAQTKAGKRFTGWRFSAPTPVQSGN